MATSKLSKSASMLMRYAAPTQLSPPLPSDKACTSLLHSSKRPTKRCYTNKHALQIIIFALYQLLTPYTPSSMTSLLMYSGVPTQPMLPCCCCCCCLRPAGCCALPLPAAAAAAVDDGRLAVLRLLSGAPAAAAAAVLRLSLRACARAFFTSSV
jgi:hypothetical protein